MEVEILLKETIKPSSSTPEHLKNYKFSLLDQLAPPVYVPVILFYSSTPDNQTSSTESDHLKNSLSETLSAFYPLAGRVKDIYSIDCNDQGASYIEARVTGDMSLILHDPDISDLDKLLPFDIHDQISSNSVILAIQVNHFDCGGMAICICIWHAIADASAAASFVTSWAAVASGLAATDIDGVIFDCASVFPPQDIGDFSLYKNVAKDMSKNLTKRFVFDHSKLALLREKVGNGCRLSRPSRVETVATVVWSASMIAQEEDENTILNSAAIVADLRKRMNPPFPKLSLGSAFQPAMANCSKNENPLDYKGLVEKIHDAIETMTDQYVRMIHEGGRYFEYLRKSSEETSKNPNMIKYIGISSWCKFPFYQTDFGWGKPIWVGTALKLHKVAVFIDTKDGEGIEAWLTLPKEEMLKFEQNPDICSYASFNPTT